MSLAACLLLTGWAAAQADESLRVDQGGLVTYNRIAPALGEVPVTVAYFRGDFRENGRAFLWPVLEPAPGEYDFSSFLDVLDEAEAQGIKVGIRLMTAHPFVGPNHPTLPPFFPPWIKSVAVERNGRTAFAPDWDDPEVQTSIRNWIVALGDAIGEHPAFAFADVGAVGWVGEWHTTVGWLNSDFMPTLENQKRYVDFHIEAFGADRLVLQLGDMPTAVLAHGLEQGILGVRQDCFGSNYHMRQYEQKLQVLPQLQDVIDHGLVFFEICGSNMSEWTHAVGDPNFVTQSPEEIFAIARRWKTTHYANMGAEIPDRYKDLYEALQRDMQTYLPKPARE
ncbi:MAG: beta-galactosidase [Bacteroidota bacterium]